MSFAAAILMEEEERQIVERFQAAGSTTAESGQPLDELGNIQKNALRRLLKRGVIRESPAGSYFLDEAKLRAPTSRRTRTVVTLIAIGLLVAMIAYVKLNR